MYIDIAGLAFFFNPSHFVGPFPFREPMLKKKASPAQNVIARRASNDVIAKRVFNYVIARSVSDVAIYLKRASLASSQSIRILSIIEQTSLKVLLSFV